MKIKTEDKIKIEPKKETRKRKAKEDIFNDIPIKERKIHMTRLKTREAEKCNVKHNKMDLDKKNETSSRPEESRPGRHTGPNKEIIDNK